MGNVLGWLCLSALALVLLFIAAILLHALWVRYKWRTNNWPLAYLLARLGWGRSVRYLARQLEMDPEELRRHEPRYQRAHVAKRSGGTRLLSIPDAKTKKLQRRLLRRVLARLAAHPAACGFERGKSIVENALPHVGQAVVVRIDVIDFFPSTRAGRIEAYFRRIGWNAEAAALLTRLVTYDGGLPQGAPTSPRLSNLVNYYLDVQLTRLARRYQANYTRYADDITLSMPRDYPRRVRGIVQLARRLLLRHGYEIHRHKKLTARRRHQRQMVTGLVVNDGVNLPRTTRRRLRAARHHVATRRRATLTEVQLEGWAALENMVRTRAAQNQ